MFSTSGAYAKVKTSCQSGSPAFLPHMRRLDLISIESCLPSRWSSLPLPQCVISYQYHKRYLMRADASHCNFAIPHCSTESKSCRS